MTPLKVTKNAVDNDLSLFATILGHIYKFVEVFAWTHHLGGQLERVDEEETGVTGVVSDFGTTLLPIPWSVAMMVGCNSSH